MSRLKVRHLSDDTYQVVEFYLSDDDRYKYEDESVLHQGSIADCEAYIRLRNSDLLE
jgi:hypothetical protein